MKTPLTPVVALFLMLGAALSLRAGIHWGVADAYTQELVPQLRQTLEPGHGHRGSPTPTPSASPTLTPPPSPTPSSTVTPTYTASPTPSPSPTATPTNTPDCLSWNVDDSTGANSSRAYGIAVDPQGYSVVAGYDFDVSRGNMHTVKYDDLGNSLWAREDSTGTGSRGIGAAFDPSGNVAVVGWRYNGSRYLFYTVYYNAAGTLQWSALDSTGTASEANGVATDGSGNVYVTGYYDTAAQPNGVMRTNGYASGGHPKWTADELSGTASVGYGVATDSAGDVVVTGAVTNASRPYTMHTVKYDSSGNTLWAEEDASGTQSWGQGVAVDGSGDVVVTGMYDTGSRLVSRTIKYDGSGNELWATDDSAGISSQGGGVAVNGAGNVVVTGQYGTSAHPAAIMHTIWLDGASGSPVGSPIDDSSGTDCQGLGVGVDASGAAVGAGFYDTGTRNGTIRVVRYPGC
jgi:hypothetical protein